MPNVFLAQINIRTGIDEEGNELWDNPEHAPVTRFDAKSAYREPNKILRNSKGNDQAGIYILANLSKAEIQHVQMTPSAQHTRLALMPYRQSCIELALLWQSRKRAIFVGPGLTICCGIYFAMERYCMVARSTSW